MNFLSNYLLLMTMYWSACSWWTPVELLVELIVLWWTLFETLIPDELIANLVLLKASTRNCSCWWWACCRWTGLADELVVNLLLDVVDEFLTENHSCWWASCWWTLCQRICCDEIVVRAGYVAEQRIALADDGDELKIALCCQLTLSCYCWLPRLMYILSLSPPSMERWVIIDDKMWSSELLRSMITKLLLNHLLMMSANSSLMILVVQSLKSISNKTVVHLMDHVVHKVVLSLVVVVGWGFHSENAVQKFVALDVDVLLLVDVDVDVNVNAADDLFCWLPLKNSAENCRVKHPLLSWGIRCPLLMQPMSWCILLVKLVHLSC